MERNFIYDSPDFSGYRNLAADEWFLDHVGEEDLILHFYQNENAVIIGKNQNPWAECNLEAMEKDGVELVRRVSGGGAVYHDMGNLNFSFIAGKNRYDKEKFQNMILEAVRALGIDATISGRNDMIFEGKKFSGNAFANRKGKNQFHGTLLISANLEKLPSYLTVDPKKIQSKGIASVRSRVCNLTEITEDLTVKKMKKALVQKMEETFGFWGEWLFSPSEKEALSEYETRHRSLEWRLGQTPRFDFRWNERLSWGSVEILLSFEKGMISKAEVFSDGMETSLCDEIKTLLEGKAFASDTVKNAFLSSSREEICELGNVFSLFSE